MAAHTCLLLKHSRVRIRQMPQCYVGQYVTSQEREPWRSPNKYQQRTFCFENLLSKRSKMPNNLFLLLVLLLPGRLIYCLLYTGLMACKIRQLHSIKHKANSTLTAQSYREFKLFEEQEHYSRHRDDVIENLLLVQ